MKQSLQPIEKFGYFHLAMVHELFGHYYSGNTEGIEEMRKRVWKADKEYEAFLKDGTLPEWMTESVIPKV